MKFSKFLPSLLTGMLFIVSTPIFAQSEAQETSTISASNSEQENLAAESELNQRRTSDATALKKEYRAKARQAKRVERDASYASKQARKSLRMEKQAQKARKRAEKQSKKSIRAAEKSDNN